MVCTNEHLSIHFFNCFYCSSNTLIYSLNCLNCSWFHSCMSHHIWVCKIDNNYIIFRTSYYHFKDHVNLYLLYPKEYYDVYIYGPLFTVFIAPLSLMPEGWGFFFWEVGNWETARDGTANCKVPSGNFRVS